MKENWNIYKENHGSASQACLFNIYNLTFLGKLDGWRVEKRIHVAFLNQNICQIRLATLIIYRDLSPVLFNNTIAPLRRTSLTS